MDEAVGIVEFRYVLFLIGWKQSLSDLFIVRSSLHSLSKLCGSFASTFREVMLVWVTDSLWLSPHVWRRETFLIMMWEQLSSLVSSYKVLLVTVKSIFCQESLMVMVTNVMVIFIVRVHQHRVLITVLVNTVKKWIVKGYQSLISWLT